MIRLPHIPKEKQPLAALIPLGILMIALPLSLWALKNARVDIRQQAQTTDHIPQDASVTCTLRAYADDPRNIPSTHTYYLSNSISTIAPGQNIVWGISFRNPSNYDFDSLKNFISLGRFQTYLDGSSPNCQIDDASKSLDCNHGVFLRNGASSMAFRTQFTGNSPIPLDTLAVSFTNTGTTKACSYSLN